MKRFRFDTFLIDDSNRRAVELCLNLAEGKAASSLTIVLQAGTGCGKTHLLYSIVNRIRASARKVGIAYVRAGDFPQRVRDLVEDPSAVEGAKEAILLIDDVDDFSENLDDLSSVVQIFLANGHAVVFATGGRPENLQSLPDSLRQILEDGILLTLGPAPVEGAHSAQEGIAERTPESSASNGSAKAHSTDGREASGKESALSHVPSVVPADPEMEKLIVDLRSQLKDAQAEGQKAREDTDSVLSRAETLLAEVQEGRQRISEAQQAQTKQMDEIQKLDALIRGQSLWDEAGLPLEPNVDSPAAFARESIENAAETSPELESRLASLESELNTLALERDAARKKLSSELPKLRTALKLVTEERDDARRTADEGEHSQAESSRLQERFGSLSAQYENSENTAARLREALTEREAENSSMAAELANARRQLDDLRNDAAQRLAAAEVQVGEVREELAAVCLEVDRIYQANRSVGNDLQSLRSRLSKEEGASEPSVDDTPTPDAAAQRARPDRPSASTLAPEAPKPAPPVAASPPNANVRRALQKLRTAALPKHQKSGTLEPLQALGASGISEEIEFPPAGRAALHHVEQLQSTVRLIPPYHGEPQSQPPRPTTREDDVASI